MSTLLTWIEASALGHYIRESGPWTYALVNLAHILGVGTLFGSVLVLDLTLLRVWRGSERALPFVADVAAPVAAVGFVFAVASGICLLASNATEYLGNPFFIVKFPVIALGFGNALVINRTAAWRALGTRELAPQEGRRLAWMGGTSLACWTGAVAAGRMIGYW